MAQRSFWLLYIAVTCETCNEGRLCIGRWCVGSHSQLTSLPVLLQVWRALCIPYNEEVAVKLLDLENVNCSLVRCCGSLQGSKICPTSCTLVASAGPDQQALHACRTRL